MRAVWNFRAQRSMPGVAVDLLRLRAASMRHTRGVQRVNNRILVGRQLLLYYLCSFTFFQVGGSLYWKTLAVVLRKCVFCSFFLAPKIEDEDMEEEA